MLVGLCGGICAGKASIASFLISGHGFKQIHLSRPSSDPTPASKPLSSALHKSSVATLNSASDGLISKVTNGETERSFGSLDALLTFVTKRWQERWVTTDIWSEEIVDTLMRRPFFLLISVDAPVSTRWERYTSRCTSQGQDAPSLEQFVLRNDEHLYSPSSGLAHLLHRAQLRLVNNSSSLQELYSSLWTLDLANEARLRPSWDQYFMQLASLAAQRSNCMKRRVGCVLVSNHRVVSTGYNGTPRGLRNCNQGGCPRCNDASAGGVGLDTCLCLHAEENALLEAGRDRIREGSILYCDTCPCLTCSIKITQVGIAEVVYSQAYSMDGRTAAIFEEGGVRLRQFVPPRGGLVDLSTIADT